MKNKYYSSDFYCTKCGNKTIPIPRKAGQDRDKGHLKKIYCLHCQECNNCAEVKPFGSYTYEDFLEEFELGRFVEGNRIPIADLQDCNKEECNYNRNRKCWNANHSYNCKGDKNND